MKKLYGYFVILTLCGITVLLWLLSKQDYTILSEMPLRALSQITALLGVVLISITLLLTTRLWFLEEIFGGLDKNYILHHLLGILGFLLVLNHPLLLVAQALPSMPTALSYVWIGSDWGYNFGILALYLMLISFICMFFIKLAYQWWLVSHDLLGLAFGVASLHVLMISSDVSESLALRIWMIFFMAVGVGSASYMIILYQRYGRRSAYQISQVEVVRDVVNIILRPQKRPLPFFPGQFVYFKCISPYISHELHPFSPSTAGTENDLRISAKMVGDYTKQLAHVDVGTKVYLYGPHGRFGEVYQRSSHKMIWIGGGIGVTPFLSMLRSEAMYPKHQDIIFFYVTRTSSEQLYLPEINVIKTQTPNVTVLPWDSEAKGRLNAQAIKATVQGDLQSYTILLCGPPPMMQTLFSQLQSIGVPADHIIFEQFNFV